MRIWMLLVVLLPGCAVHPRRPEGLPPLHTKDGALVAGVAAGTASTPVVVTGAVVTATAAVVATAVVGAEQFPDPPAGTPPTSVEPREPRKCGSCRCYGKGKGPKGLGSYHDPGSGGGMVEFTRAICQQQCDERGYTGFKCTGDKDVNWFN